MENVHPELRHTCKALFGKLVGQKQDSGQWAVSFQLAQTETPPRRPATLMKDLLASLGMLKNEGLPKLHSFDDAKFQCLWALPKRPLLVPLSTLRMPLPAAEVEKLVRTLAETLDHLHQVGLGAYDLAPGVVFGDGAPELQEGRRVEGCRQLRPGRPARAGQTPRPGPYVDIDRPARTAGPEGRLRSRSARRSPAN
jgi:hypothetical protein